MRTILAGLTVGVVAASCGFAQSVISAHSGVIHYTEGKVLVGDKVYEQKTAEFSELKPNQVLKTEEGRAEMLLTPGVFLRIGENSSVRMISNHLSDTRVELLNGEALVECDELLKDNQVTIAYKDSTVAIAKNGLYRFDVPPGRLRVYDGEAVVQNPSGQLTAKKGHEVALGTSVLMASKFDSKSGDELMRWASRRSGYISMANVAAARSAGTSGYASSYYGGWTFNPYFGMYTFIPMNGIIYSPFGDPFWSPYAAFMYAPYWGGYYPYFGYGYGYGYGGYGGYGSGNAVRAAARWNGSSTPYSSSRVARSAPTGVAGAGRRGFGGGNSGFGAASPGFGGRSMGGYSGGGYSGGGYSGGGAAVGSSGGGMSGAAAGGGGGGHAGGAGGGHR